jgi:hypothetical protein
MNYSKAPKANKPDGTAWMMKTRTTEMKTTGWTGIGQKGVTAKMMIILWFLVLFTFTHFKDLNT